MIFSRTGGLHDQNVHFNRIILIAVSLCNITLSADHEVPLTKGGKALYVFVGLCVCLEHECTSVVGALSIYVYVLYVLYVLYCSGGREASLYVGCILMSQSSFHVCTHYVLTVPTTEQEQQRIDRMEGVVGLLTYMHAMQCRVSVYIHR